jgi:hypothetical protein
MKLSRRSLLLTVAGSAVIVLLWYEANHGAEYRIGMSISEVRQLQGRNYPVRRFAREYDRPPSALERETDTIYYIMDEQNGILLEFNHNEKLIEKHRMKWLGINWSKVAELLRLGK